LSAQLAPDRHASETQPARAAGLATRESNAHGLLVLRLATGVHGNLRLIRAADPFPDLLSAPANRRTAKRNRTSKTIMAIQEHDGDTRFTCGTWCWIRLAKTYPSVLGCRAKPSRAKTHAMAHLQDGRCRGATLNRGPGSGIRVSCLEIAATPVRSTGCPLGEMPLCRLAANRYRPRVRAIGLRNWRMAARIGRGSASASG
jgi:hypothetical protein